MFGLRVPKKVENLVVAVVAKNLEDVELHESETIHELENRKK